MRKPHVSGKSSKQLSDECVSAHRAGKADPDHSEEREKADMDNFYKELADMMGISQSYISRLEKRIIGKIKSEILREYAR